MHIARALWTQTLYVGILTKSCGMYCYYGEIIRNSEYLRYAAFSIKKSSIFEHVVICTLANYTREEKIRKTYPFKIPMMMIMTPSDYSFASRHVGLTESTEITHNFLFQILWNIMWTRPIAWQSCIWLWLAFF